MRTTTILHKSPPAQALLLAKCRCRQIVRIPPEGCLCLCGRKHVRVENLPGTVRTKVIEG